MIDSEPKWVLKRLMAMLHKDLKDRAEKHIERDIGRIAPSSDSSENLKVDDEIEPSSSLES